MNTSAGLLHANTGRSFLITFPTNLIQMDVEQTCIFSLEQRSNRDNQTQFCQVLISSHRGATESILTGSITNRIGSRTGPGQERSKAGDSKPPRTLWVSIHRVSETSVISNQRILKENTKLSGKRYRSVHRLTTGLADSSFSPQVVRLRRNHIFSCAA